MRSGVMPSVRSSVQSAAYDVLRCGASAVRGCMTRCLTGIVLLLLPAALLAQQPVLRIGAGADARAVDGAVVDGAAAFPAAALEVLGFRLAGAPGGLTAVIDADTLRFWTTSPFFRAGSRVHHLTGTVQLAHGATHLPEQFFIQWLPSAYPDRFEYRGGALVLKGAAAPPAAATAPVAAAAAPPAATPPPGGGRPAAGRTDTGVTPRPAAEQRVVIIDPGHGGRDPGKVGPNGLREKDVTLLISQRLAAILRERGYEVHLTRTTDTLIALADRPRLANRWRADRPVAVFLSIHANSAPGTSARGFETFFLSEARTEDERRVAEMENAAVRFEDVPATPHANELDQILNNLRGDFLMRASHDLAAVVQEKMAAFHPGPNRGVKRAGFYVLVGAIMPAVLIEAAFMSNREEANLLGTQAFQQKLAWGIADAVDEFFRRNEHLWSQLP
jgi:N-acetylmuramoyl-L-alanine amidase